jgi:hypothetical protein
VVGRRIARIEVDRLPVLGDRVLGLVLIIKNVADRIVSPRDAWIRLRPVINNPPRDLQTFDGVAIGQDAAAI